MTADHVDAFLAYAVLRYDGRDGPDRWARAEALLLEHPELPGASIAVAAAVADPVALRTQLAADPGSATATGGPLGWPPLMYLTYSRVRGNGRAADAVALLLAHGADPNSGVLLNGEVPPFTALTGLFGDGEQGESRQPAHPQALRLAEQLLRAGADPHDGQTLYNRMFSAADDHLELLFAYGLGRPGGAWRARLGDRLPEPAELVRDQLGWAVSHGFHDRLRLLAAHGVDLAAPLRLGVGPASGLLTPVQLAHRSGRRDTASLLVELGAPVETDPHWALLDALMAGDLAAAYALVDAHPTLLARLRADHPALILTAAVVDRVGAIALLAEFGFDPDALGRQDLPIDEPWESALHHAAGEGKPALARALLELGADPTIRDRRFDATPLDWARHLGRPATVEVLSDPTAPVRRAPGSRDR